MERSRFIKRIASIINSEPRQPRILIGTEVKRIGVRSPDEIQRQSYNNRYKTPPYH